MPKNSQWYKITAKDNDTAEISIFGNIGESFWSDGITAAGFKKDFDKIKNKAKINILINSPGGSLFEGTTIYNIIATQREKVSIEIMGLAASAASVIALAGSSLTMGEGTFFMIHNASGLAMGTAEVMREMAELLDKVSGEMINIYESHSDLTAEEIEAAMDAETWYTAEEAVEAGFADSVEDVGEVAASVVPLEYEYKHVPIGMMRAAEDKKPETVRELEAYLRDAGFSRQEAKAIASQGFEDGQRDADPEEDPVEEPRDFNEEAGLALASYFANE